MSLVSNKIITCNDKDAPWLNTQVKTDIRRNTRVYRKCVKRRRNPLMLIRFEKLKILGGHTYYSKREDKLSDPNPNPNPNLNPGQKTFWMSFIKIIIYISIRLLYKMLAKSSSLHMKSSLY